MDLALQSGVTTVRHRSGGRAEDRQYRLLWLIPEIKRPARVVTPDGCRLRRQVVMVVRVALVFCMAAA